MKKQLYAAITATVIHLLYCSPSISQSFTSENTNRINSYRIQRSPRVWNAVNQQTQQEQVSEQNLPAQQADASDMQTAPQFAPPVQQPHSIAYGRYAAPQQQDPLRQYALDLVNKDRKKNGSPAVSMDSSLNTVAQAYADYLARSGFFGHVDPYGRNPQDRATLYGIRKPVSENLAWASSNYQTQKELLKQSEDDMMAEPPNQMNHRYNILDPNNKVVGIGVAVLGEKVVLVQEFSSR